MELKTQRNCHALYNLQYHLILVTKYRKQCIDENVFTTIKSQAYRIAELNCAAIEEIAWEPDHVHILLSAPPQACLSVIVNSIKSTTSRMVRKYHSEHLSKYYWKPCFWNRSYLILSSGGAPIEIIRKYIREQGTLAHRAKKNAANST